jgi:pantoate--beta-alanine ligase
MAFLKPAPDRALIERSPAGLRRWRQIWRRSGERVGFVPTMGALHRGHLALVEALTPVADRVVVSIFVNPTQFAPGEDFARYPRSEAEDIAKLDALGVDVVYLPTATDMYPKAFATEISVAGPLTERLEAVIRPGHFTGVATVVAKLLLQLTPEAVAFGEKDYQQLQIVRRMVADLDMPTEIVAVPTVRDDEGLALSSRNAYLSPAERQVARQLNKILARTADRLRAGMEAASACAEAAEELVRIGFAGVDYLALADPDDLTALARLDRPARLLAAARIGRTRLIDNIAVAP